MKSIIILPAIVGVCLKLAIPLSLASWSLLSSPEPACPKHLTSPSLSAFTARQLTGLQARALFLDLCSGDSAS